MLKTRSQCYSQLVLKPNLPKNPAFQSALTIIQSHRSQINTQISDLQSQLSGLESSLTSSTDSNKLMKDIEKTRSLLKKTIMNEGYLDLKKHDHFLKKKRLIEKDAILFDMKLREFERISVPKLMKMAESWNLYKDVFPNAIKPKAMMTINFPNTNWKHGFSSGIPANWALYSPQIEIFTSHEETKLYTLIMVDLDHANAQSGKYEQLCHWMVCNIPIGKSTTLPFGSSPYLINPEFVNTGKGTLYYQAPPKQEPIIPGDVVFGYVPPHPAFEAPRHAHRYVFALLDQTESIDVNALKAKLSKQKNDYLSLIKSKESPEDARFEMLERGMVGPLWKFKQKMGMNLMGYSFFGSTWNPLTSEIFKMLGKKEPVYAEIPKKDKTIFETRLKNTAEVMKHAIIEDEKCSLDAPSFIEIINKKSEIASPVPLERHGFNFGRLRNSVRDLLNEGRRPDASRVDINIYPKVEALIQANKEKIEKKLENEAKKKGESVETIRQQVLAKRQAWRIKRKIPRFEPRVVAAFVRHREALNKGN